MNSEQKTTTTTDNTDWWQEALSRRQASKRLAALGIAATALASSGILAGCGEDDAVEAERDALDVQKELGWNAGAETKQLSLTNISPTDSRGSLDWKRYLEPSALISAYQPRQSAWKPFVSPTLAQSLAQPTLRSGIQPVVSKSMEEAYAQGLGMKDLLSKSEHPEDKAILVDLPGPEAVAYAAALSDVADPVMTFDNWPHPNGVVPSEQTLGALVYYASEFSESAAKRPEKAPALFIMDSNRLAPYKDESDKFDNRYAVSMPTPDNFVSQNVKGLLYTVPGGNRQTELDDLNDDFVAYKEKGINVSMIPLSDFKPVSAEALQEHGAVDSTGTASTTTHGTYYYGGHPYFSPFFFAYYPLFIASRGYGSYSNLRTPSVSRPSYAPTSRNTMFSSGTVGGRGGVGKQKPSGFGRVSTRTSSSGQTSVGRRSGSGRSGSYGRSGGRGFSG